MAGHLHQCQRRRLSSQKAPVRQGDAVSGRSKLGKERTKILQETFTLPNGVEIPKLGLGTWMIDDDKVAEAVKAAVKLGYRHIDTAQAYANERGVGEGVRDCGVARDELFVTTKLDAGIKDYEGAKAAIDGSLETLGLEYIDLMIIHSPQPWQEFAGDDRFFEAHAQCCRTCVLWSGALSGLAFSECCDAVTCRVM